LRSCCRSRCSVATSLASFGSWAGFCFLMRAAATRPVKSRNPRMLAASRASRMPRAGGPFEPLGVGQQGGVVPGVRLDRPQVPLALSHPPPPVRRGSRLPRRPDAGPVTSP
jgi:hypothetical protein